MLFAITLAITIKNEPFTVELRTSRDQTCLLTDQNGNKWPFAPKRLNPWQLRAGDVDGNNKMDFLIGVYKRTHLIPHPHRTLFIYEFDGEEVRAKWKASTMGRPLLDFAFAKLDQGPRVITVEKNIDESEAVTIWKWRGFGLIKVEELAQGKSIQLDPSPWPDKTVVANIDGKALKWKR
jgi:hypothetical protein